ncbi:MAG: papain-like cysteine peptidase [Elusimicrobiota bacterium]|nr:papain-like cysteine peptidase [Elusimicrobiota bacterium]
MISLGNACRPAYYLRENNLRIASNPLDWMMRYSLETVIHLFKTQFSDFFSNVWEDISKYENNKRRYVIDLDTNMIDMHLFPKNLSLEQGKIRHHDIMKRRYERMHNAMLCSNRILFISNRNEPIEQFKNFLLSICGIYHKEITYINIRNSEIESKSQIKFTKKLKFIEYSFRDIHKNGAQKNENKDFWLGNVDKWNNIMQTIELSGKIKP